jgi:hypothetical protein
VISAGDRKDAVRSNGIGRDQIKRRQNQRLACQLQACVASVFCSRRKSLVSRCSAAAQGLVTQKNIPLAMAQTIANAALTIPPQPATYYRRKAAQARQAAEGATTRGMKARLLDEAVHCDQLAADADRGAGAPSLGRQIVPLNR